jgi:hypothetical protein
MSKACSQTGCKRTVVSGKNCDHHKAYARLKASIARLEKKNKQAAAKPATNSTSASSTVSEEENDASETRPALVPAHPRKVPSQPAKRKRSKSTASSEDDTSSKRSKVSHSFQRWEPPCATRGSHSVHSATRRRRSLAVRMTYWIRFNKNTNSPKESLTLMRPTLCQSRGMTPFPLRSMI